MLRLPSIGLRSYRRRESDAAIAFLAHLAGDLSAALSLDELLMHVTRTSRMALGLEACSVALVEDDGDSGVRVRATSGLNNRYLNLKIPAGQGLHGEVMRTRCPLLVADITANPRAWHVQPGIGSAIYAPVVVHSQVIGVVSAFRATKRAFAQADLDALTVIGRYVADGIETVRLGRVKEEMFDANRQLMEAFDHSCVGMVVATVEDGTILRWSGAVAHIYGYTQDEVVGRPLTTLTPHGGNGVWDEMLATLRRGDVVRSLDAVHRTKDGGSRRVALMARPVPNAAGKVRWALITVAPSSGSDHPPSRRPRYH